MRRRLLDWVRLLAVALFLILVVASTRARASAPLVPGTGSKISEVGDDFEDEEWRYIFNLPKSSEENDGQVRPPGGYSANGRWAESAKRGQPDVIRRVPTPGGGLPGSTHALLLGTRESGVPGRFSRRLQQDDLLMQVAARIGAIPVSTSPSVVVRVYVPPFERFLEHSAASFALRGDLIGVKSNGWRNETEPYWPGMFIVFNSKTDPRHAEDSAFIRIRANASGYDVAGPQVTPGWWTLGMSFTPDGMVHYFAREGVEDLTAEDHLASYYSYSLRAQQLRTIIFNVANADDGRWSTPWVIDEPSLYWHRPAGPLAGSGTGQPAR